MFLLLGPTGKPNSCAFPGGLTSAITAIPQQHSSQKPPAAASGFIIY